jgi:transposase
VVSAKQLEQVRRLASRVEAAESALRAAIVVAGKGGASLREVAKAAGRSHEFVRKVINKQERNQA